MIKTIEKYPNYAVDRYGNVFNTKFGRQLKPNNEKSGYLSVFLFQNGKGKRIKVHRLVAEAFIPNPLNLPCVNHKDENKSNNDVNNLEWCDQRYNNHYGNNKPTIHAQNARKKSVCQYTVEGDLVAVYESACEAERRTGIRQANISRCCLERPHFITAGGYVWKFEIKESKGEIKK